MLGLDLSEDGDLLFSSGGDSVVNVSFVPIRGINVLIINRRFGPREHLKDSTLSTLIMMSVIFLPSPTLPVSRPSTVVARIPASRCVGLSRVEILYLTLFSGATSQKQTLLRLRHQQLTYQVELIAFLIPVAPTAPVHHAQIPVQMAATPSRKAAKF